MSNPLGWAYPAGAENDPNAPWNQNDDEADCDDCGEAFHVDDLTKTANSFNVTIQLCNECLQERKEEEEEEE